MTEDTTLEEAVREYRAQYLKESQEPELISGLAAYLFHKGYKRWGRAWIEAVDSSDPDFFTNSAQFTATKK